MQKSTASWNKRHYRGEQRTLHFIRETGSRPIKAEGWARRGREIWCTWAIERWQRLWKIERLRVFGGYTGRVTIGAPHRRGRRATSGACHISLSARVRKSLSTRGGVDRVVTRYANIQHIHLVCREHTWPSLPLSSHLPKRTSYPNVRVHNRL